MDRSIIYVWDTGGWIFGADYHYGTHSIMGDYREFNIGSGFNISDINEMVNTYLKDLWED